MVGLVLVMLVAVLPVTTAWLEGLCVIAGAIPEVTGTNSTELAV
jgi:uncharacterized membrane protein